LVAPGFGVEGQAQDDVGTKVRVDSPGAFANFTRPIKENLALPADGLLSRWIVGPMEIFRRVFNSLSLENGARRFPKIVRAIGCDRLRFVADEGDPSAERAQFFGEHLGDEQ